MNKTFLERIAAGDQTAVEDCIDHYGNLVWSIARRMSDTESDAEDAVQDIFIDLWKNAARFNPDLAAEKTFIVMIARRRLIDRVRHRRSRPETALTEEIVERDGARQPSPEQSADTALAAKVIAELKPEQQRVLKLSIHLGMSHGEIASTTNMAIGTVKSHIRRGLSFVRKRLMESAGPGRLMP